MTDENDARLENKVVPEPVFEEILDAIMFQPLEDAKIASENICTKYQDSHFADDVKKTATIALGINEYMSKKG